ncbi:MAG: GNAT family N-acetyltransferase [Leptolyngbya sp. DLM2.Bin15]|nr:MAG: GNAT family N-acetyltransferase [Leptolyngbya sp. DLM2.Bin15]
MEIQFARSDLDIAQCFPIMVQLRPHLDPAEFVSQVQRQQQVGYHLVYLDVDEAVQAIAGFRIVETLANGKVLYIDDLVTDGVAQGNGYGKALIDWLLDYARSKDCASIHLDSGVQRPGAHRFYFGRGMTITAFHFGMKLDPDL